MSVHEPTELWCVVAPSGVTAMFGTEAEARAHVASFGADIRERLVVARYLRAQKAGDESAAHASVIAREAEVRGGELLKAMNLKAETQVRGGRGNTVGKNDPTVTKAPLRSLGLTPSESKRMQAAAAVPEKANPNNSTRLADG